MSFGKTYQQNREASFHKYPPLPQVACTEMSVWVISYTGVAFLFGMIFLERMILSILFLLVGVCGQTSQKVALSSQLASG